MKYIKSALLLSAIFIPSLIFAESLSGPGGIFVGQFLNEGSTITKRSKINWTGAGVDCADNPSLNRIDCSVISLQSSGPAALGIFGNDVLVSSPTSALNFASPIQTTLQGQTSAYLTIDTTTVSGLLAISSATATYLQISSITAFYVNASSISATYLNSNTASSTYFPITSTSTLIHNRNSLQSGATFYTSSGTVSGTFTAGKIEISSTTPTLTLCGTSPSIIGNDSAGTITVGTGSSATSCVVTFSGPWTNAPTCMATCEAQYIIVGSSTTTTFYQISSTGPFVSGGKIKYLCNGWK